MCDPISAVSAGLGILNYVSGQSNAARAAEASNRSTALSYQQQNERLQQVNEQSALDKSERIKQGMLERAQVATIAGESGALGFSSDRLILDSFMQEGTDISSLEKNRLNNERQTEWSKLQAEAGGQSTNNSAYSNAPSLLGTGLQVGLETYGGYTRARDRAKAEST